MRSDAAWRVLHAYWIQRATAGNAFKNRCLDAVNLTTTVSHFCRRQRSCARLADHESRHFAALRVMLDPVSILIVTVLSGIVSMAVLGSLRPARIPGVTYWIGANALAIVGLILFTLQRIAPPYLSIVAANAIFSLAVLFVLQGCRQFFGQPAFNRQCAYRALVGFSCVRLCIGGLACMA
jgi:hypothetical protein